MTKSYKIVSYEKSRNEFIIEYNDDGIAGLLNIGFPGEVTEAGIRKHVLRHWPTAHISSIKSSREKDDTFIKEMLEMNINVSEQEIDIENKAIEAEVSALVGAGPR